jgi:hypothetical protein
MTSIPKILHVMWIGAEKTPINLMMSWKHKNPDFEFIIWNEEEFIKRHMFFKCIKQVTDIYEISGKCDILRWEILYKYGGVFVDADSICIEPIDDYFMTKQAFSTYENEYVRKSLVACGMMGFIPNHNLCRDIINWISEPSLSESIIRNYKAWISVGPYLLTKFLGTGNYPDFSVFPSYTVLPMHHTGLLYEGHRKVYAHQVWGSSNQSYDIINTIKLPQYFHSPKQWVSVIVTSYDTEEKYLRNCLDSIKDQKGYFGIELVWVNDGSNLNYTEILEKELFHFGKSSRFTKIKYIRIFENKQNFKCLNIAINACSNELIFKMDSDDIMHPDRLKIQQKFMLENPDAVICGGGIRIFNESGIIKDVFHEQKISWTQFRNSTPPPTWIMSHPTLCYKKSALLSIGCYDTNLYGVEDYDIQLRLLKKFGYIYNIKDILLYYRIHSKQMTNIIKQIDYAVMIQDVLQKHLRSNLETNDSAER